MGKDTTEYHLLTKEYVSVEKFGDKEFLKVDPEGLRLLARQAMHDVSFMLRPEHNEMVAKILADPESSDNDKAVAIQMLMNADVSAKGQLPFCQDTGTATIVAKKGQFVFTGGGDEEALSHGVFDTYTNDNLRYSQNIPLDMYNEKNTGCNRPAQIDIFATDGNEYKFLFVAKGGGSANKTYLFQETKALITPDKLEPYLIEKMK
ncbi:MAG: fumarate hydratase, partial [Bacteroidales bacterium]|nr:fumarate hydratase [Bacteroidales bacterium]